MPEFPTLDRCAAFVAARTAASAAARAARHWPIALADRARREAVAAMEVTAEATAHPHASLDRRRCLRAAIARAIGVTDAVDHARALGFADPELDELARAAGRTVALLAMFFHANTSALCAP
ncbi:MAG TPA: hypothetical protein VFP84_35090 [Kofleriaceae bacterium]|nr:hypothetical protein [Kofleriaceae bacterium]